MATQSDVTWGKITKVSVFNPMTETVESLRKRVNPAFRPPWPRYVDLQTIPFYFHLDVCLFHIVMYGNKCITS